MCFMDPQKHEGNWLAGSTDDQHSSPVLSSACLYLQGGIVGGMLISQQTVNLERMSEGLIIYFI